MSDLAGALGAVYARVPLGMRLELESMHAACARAGHPERALAVVHVAGTNGKGSTCAMVESIARIIADSDEEMEPVIIPDNPGRSLQASIHAPAVPVSYFYRMSNMRAPLNSSTVL